MNNELQDNIQPFIDSVKSALNNKNYYAALTVSLTLPDMCSKLENPEGQTKERYINWFEKYLSKRYSDFTDNNRQLLNGDDFYALRCAFLHEGVTDITGQSAKKDLTNFYLTEPSDVNTFAVVKTDFKSGKNIQQVDAFCEEILSGVQQWVNFHYQKDYISKRSETLMKIHKPE